MERKLHIRQIEDGRWQFGVEQVTPERPRIVWYQGTYKTRLGAASASKTRAGLSVSA